MFKYIKINRFYSKDVYNFIYNIMKEEFCITEDDLKKITADLTDIDNNYLEFWLAINKSTNQVIGTAAIKKEGNYYQFCRFYVQKEFRSHKIGIALYRKFEEYVLLNNIHKVYLICGKELEKAQKFYMKNGWIKSKDTTPFYIRTNASLHEKSFNL